MGFKDALGRKPQRVAAWEERQQAKFEAEDAAHAAWRKRNPTVTFDGKTIHVRSAPPDESLVDWSNMTWGSGGEWLTRMPSYLSDLRKRRHDAWTVGIVLPGRFLGNERIIYREYVASESQVQAAVDQLAQRAETGEFSGPRRRS